MRRRRAPLSGAIKIQRFRQPSPFPGAAGILARSGGGENLAAFQVEDEEIASQGAAIFDVREWRSVPLEEPLPQVFKGGWPASRTDLLKGSEAGMAPTALALPIAAAGHAAALRFPSSEGSAERLRARRLRWWLSANATRWRLPQAASGAWARCRMTSRRSQMRLTSAMNWIWVRVWVPSMRNSANNSSAALRSRPTSDRMKHPKPLHSSVALAITRSLPMPWLSRKRCSSFRSSAVRGMAAGGGAGGFDGHGAVRKVCPGCGCQHSEGDGTRKLPVFGSFARHQVNHPESEGDRTAAPPPHQRTSLPGRWRPDR